MSHIEEGKTTIQLQMLVPLIQCGDVQALQQHPCMILLRQAVTLVAQAHGGQVETVYSDFHYRPQRPNTQLALVVPENLPRGIGLDVDLHTGGLVFKGDPWDHQDFFRMAQLAIAQRYIVLVHAAALRRMRAQVSTQVVDDQVVITGVFHG